MVSANELKSGVVFDYNGAPHMVENVTKQTPSARGASTLYKIRARNILTKNKSDLTCRGEDMFQQPNFQTRQVQYLYSDGDVCSFLDLETFEQYDMDARALEDQLFFMPEGMESITALILNDRMVGVNLPDTVVLELVECDPAIKTASATARSKTAKTQTGLSVQVPEYMQQGEKVKIDTRTGKCLSRA